jgi:hypothetical protein
MQGRATVPSHAYAHARPATPPGPYRLGKNRFCGWRCLPIGPAWPTWPACSNSPLRSSALEHACLPGPAHGQYDAFVRRPRDRGVVQYLENLEMSWAT